jgi:hypothetical protein
MSLVQENRWGNTTCAASRGSGKQDDNANDGRVYPVVPAPVHLSPKRVVMEQFASRIVPVLTRPAPLKQDR